MCVRVHVCMCVCVHVCECTRSFVCVYVCMCLLCVHSQCNKLKDILAVHKISEGLFMNRCPA